MPVDHAITTLIDVIEEHVNLLTSEAKVKCSEGISIKVITINIL
jgi:hypothetical protein